MALFHNLNCHQQEISRCWELKGYSFFTKAEVYVFNIKTEY